MFASSGLRHVFDSHPASSEASWLVVEATDYMSQGLATSTDLSYGSGIRRLQRFSSTFSTAVWKILWWRPDPLMLILFASYLATFVEVGTIKVYIAGIRYFALARGLDDPTDNYFFEMVWRGIKRTKKTAADLRRALTLSDFRIVAHFVISLADKCATGKCHDLIAVATIMNWGILGVLRIGELVRSGPGERILKESQVSVFDEPRLMLRLTIDGSKTQPFRSKIVVPLAAQENQRICPVKWRNRYVASCTALKLKNNPDGPFFRWSDGKEINRSSFVAKARNILIEVGFKDVERFNGISLRRGGAKSLALAGTPETSIMRAGRWTSGAYRRYIQCEQEEIMDDQIAMASAD